MDQLYMVYDIGATNVKHGLLDKQGIVHSFECFSSEGKDGPFLLDQIKATIQRYQDIITGVAFSSAGVIDSEDHIIIRSGAFPSLNGFNIKDWFAKQFPHLNVSIENDGNCAVYAEKWVGTGRNMGDFITISLGTAVGGGLFLNGGLVRGMDSLAGEFGSAYINLNGRQESLNEVTGIRSVRLRYAKEKQMDVENLTGEAIFPHYPTGEVSLDEIIDDFYSGLAIFIYNLNFIINAPVIISGGITQTPGFENRLMDQLKEYKYPDCSNVLISSLGEKANLIGALYAYLKQHS